MSAQRIYQDLVAGHGFGGSYPSVSRYVAKLKASEPERIWRIECEPGEELQVDFGLGAPLVDASGKTRRTWLFRAILSHSRKGYSEVVLRQDTETFLRVIENAVRYFGGAPRLLNFDNLKAAVIKADWYDPTMNPKLTDFCRHYGMTPMPCRSYTPQHKGKVERGVAYAKNNALKGRQFASLVEQNAHLLHWEEQVADNRVHGTTRRQVAAMFEEERKELGPLPASVYESYQEGRRRVQRDSFVEVTKAYYEAPSEFIGRKIWVRWDARMVRLLNIMSQIATLKIHARKLRLGGLAETLETRLLEASSNRLGHDEFLELLFQDELAVREGARRIGPYRILTSLPLTGVPILSHRWQCEVLGRGRVFEGRRKEFTGLSKRFLGQRIRLIRRERALSANEFV